MDKLKLPPQVRDVEVADIQVRAADDKDKVYRVSFSLSSEKRIERWFGDEVLSHADGAIRLERAKKGAMPLLFNHDWDSPIGMIDKARVEGGRLVVDAHLFDTDKARDVQRMLDGGLRNVSVGYRIHVVEEDKKTGVFTARDWEPFEASIVSVPADHSVGIGRQLAGEELEVRMVRASHTAETARKAAGMDPKDKPEEGASAADTAVVEKDKGDAIERALDKVERATGAQLEAMRVSAIRKLAKANRLDDTIRDAWISQGYTVDQVAEDIINILEERGKSNPQPASRLGLTRNEVQRFSFSRAIVAAASGKWKDAGFELECSKSVAQKLGKQPEENRFYVPFEVMERPLDEQVREYLTRIGKGATRDLTVATAGAGGYLVATDNVGFIEMLRNRSVVFTVGARRLSGLVGNVTIPRQSAAASAIWLANEASTITESQQTFVQLALSPKSVGAYTEISRQLLLQSSPGAEGIVTDDLAQVVAIAADLAGLEGSGAAGQPTGLANTAGIGNVAAGAASYAKVLEFQEDVATANVRPMRGAYVTHPTTASVLMQKQRFTSTDTPLWAGNIWEGSVSGFPGLSSNQLAAGVIDFGDWSEMVIAEWGVLEVEVNPYANFQAGIIGVRAIYSMDVGIRRPFAFSRATGITA